MSNTVSIEPKPGGVYGFDWCSSPHPDYEHVWCRRRKRHDGDCAAFVFSITQPETWETPHEI